MHEVIRHVVWGTVVGSSATHWGSGSSVASSWCISRPGGETQPQQAITSEPGPTSPRRRKVPPHQSQEVRKLQKQLPAGQSTLVIPPFPFQPLHNISTQSSFPFGPLSIHRDVFVVVVVTSANPMAQPSQSSQTCAIQPLHCL